MDIEPTPKTGPEKAMLRAFLQSNRAVVVWKANGMADDAARTTPFASDTSMIGLLQHLAIVEMSWFQNIFAGREVEWGFDFDADRDAEWHLDGTETLTDAVALYEEAIAASNEIIDVGDLDDIAARELRGERYSLRWIMIHMIEETARHAGHADIVREHLDGTLGYLPST